MQARYETPEMEVVELASENLIATSGLTGHDEGGTAENPISSDSWNNLFGK